MSAITDSDKSQLLQPRGIIGPIATLLGLMIASIGFLRTANLPSNLTDDLTSTILVIALTFVITAVFASFYVYTGRRTYWQLALFFFPVSWSGLLIGLLLMLITLAYGNVLFQLLNSYGLSPPNFFILVLILFSVFWSAVVLYRNGKFLIRKISKMGGDPGKAMKVDYNLESERKIVLEASQEDLTSMFIQLFIKIEVVIRELFNMQSRANSEKNPNISTMIRKMRSDDELPDDLYYQLKFLSNIRNRLVHGYSVPISDIQRGVNLAEVVSQELKDVAPSKNAKGIARG